MSKTRSNPAAMQQSKQAKANGPGFRISPQGDIIVPSMDSLTKLTVDPQLRAALTAAGAKLVVEIDATGTSVFLADRRSSQIIGGPEDLQKIGGIRAFITRERKESSALEIGVRVKHVAYLASLYNLSVEPGYTQMPMDTGFTASVKPILSLLEIIQKNEQKVRDNANPANREVVEAYLLSQCLRVKKVYLEYIALLVTGGETKGKLNELLFQAGVPTYVHTKLINNSLVIDKTQDLNRVLFPADPSKGITFTLKEWRSRGFLTKQGGILVRSAVPQRIAADDDFIGKLCRFADDIDLSDVDSPSVLSALKGKLFVIPYMRDLRYLTSAGGKVKSNGWKFPSVNMETASGAVSAIGLAILRVYAANLQTIDLCEAYYGVVAPGSVSITDVSPTNNFYVQWAATLDEEGRCDIHNDIITGGSTPTKSLQLVNWICTEMRISDASSLRKGLREIMHLPEEGIVNDDPLPVGYRPSSPIRPTAVPVVAIPSGLDVVRKLEPVEIVQASTWAMINFPPRKVKEDKSRSEAAMTPLGQGAKSLVVRVSRISPYVGKALSSWLRGFNSSRIQDAAAQLGTAKFDELFIQEGLVETESLDGASEVGDWADQTE